jgi:hypothetical protein
MIFPAYGNDLFGYPVAMALAVVIGMGFGFSLERGGFGSALVLVDQFYLRDMRVLKVMFSAIVTATIGLGALGGMGVVDLAMISIPSTILWAQLVGGLVLGVGFIVSGYCPGTAVVAGASGNLGGAFTLVGVMLGAALFGYAFPIFEPLYEAGAMGTLAFPELTGLPWAVLSGSVAAMAIGAFLFAEFVERWTAKREGHPPPDQDAPARTTRNMVFSGFVAVTALGLAMLAFPPEPTVSPELSVAQVDALDLAARLVNQPDADWVVDLRSAADCEAERIPGALCLGEDDTEALLLAGLPATRRLVLYGEGDLAEVPDSAGQYPGEVVAVTGGWQAFRSAVLLPPEPLEDPTPAEAERFAMALALHGHYTGVEVKRAPPPKPKVVKRVIKKGGGC